MGEYRLSLSLSSHVCLGFCLVRRRGQEEGREGKVRRARVVFCVRQGSLDVHSSSLLAAGYPSIPAPAPSPWHRAAAFASASTRFAHAPTHPLISLILFCRHFHLSPPSSQPSFVSLKTHWTFISRHRLRGGNFPSPRPLSGIVCRHPIAGGRVTRTACKSQPPCSPSAYSHPFKRRPRTGNPPAKSNCIALAVALTIVSCCCMKKLSWLFGKKRVIHYPLFSEFYMLKS